MVLEKLKTRVPLSNRKIAYTLKARFADKISLVTLTSFYTSLCAHSCVQGARRMPVILMIVIIL